jgi:hypothetical protein
VDHKSSSWNSFARAFEGSSLGLPKRSYALSASSEGIGKAAQGTNMDHCLEKSLGLTIPVMTIVQETAEGSMLDDSTMMFWNDLASNRCVLAGAAPIIHHPMSHDGVMHANDAPWHRIPNFPANRCHVGQLPSKRLPRSALSSPAAPWCTPRPGADPRPSLKKNPSRARDPAGALPCIPHSEIPACRQGRSALTCTHRAELPRLN